MRREIVIWSVVAAAIVAVFAGTVLILNTTLYSASGFVRGYLDTLVRHDVTAALDLAGLPEDTDASTELLAADAMGELADVQLVSDTVDDRGIHQVVFSFTADGKAGESSFSVRREGTLLALFPTWEFDDSPLGVLQVSPLNGTGFTVNGVDVTATAQDVPSPYLVFAPGGYELAQDSLYLRASAVQVTVSQPGAAVIAAVDLKPTRAFLDAVQHEINTFLDECTTQEVLLPTGCPFGETISNRIITAPDWSMSTYPPVTLLPGDEAGTWTMPPTTGAAHLLVDVRSLFDGSVSTFDRDVPFIASYDVTFLPGDQLLIQALY